MKTILVVLLQLGLLMVTDSCANDFERTEFKTKSKNSLRYAILKPANAEADKIYPLVITLHGVGGRGAKEWERNCYANDVLIKPEMRKKYPCFVVAPTVEKPNSWSGHRLGDVMELVEHLQTTFPVDPDRIYITGQSMGGFGTFEAILNRPNMFAAAAPVCGGNKPENAKSIVTVPIWIFHGDKDSTVPVERSREMVAALKEAGGSPKYTEFSGVGHASWTPAYDNEDLWKWMFAQQRRSSDIEEEFRKLIPAATAIDRKTFEKLATSPNPLSSEAFNEQSLSAVLLMTDVADAKENSEFHYLTDTLPKPSAIAEEMYRSIGAGKLRIVTHPVTMIQAERIKELKVKVEGEKATGSFQFHVPELYEGNANFTAVKKDDAWQITEFRMDKIKVRVARDESGLWQRVEPE